MRLRKNPKLIEQMNLDNHYLINYSENNKLDWKEIFNNDNEKIELEIGVGKGDFIIQKAINNPNINFIGIEKMPAVLAICINKLIKLENKINNLKLLVFDASELENIFSESMINKIYLNFSDPWPKKRHEKNRLTNWKFLYIYQKILLPNKTIEFKTDNDLLYLYTLNDVILNSIDKINLIYNTENLYENLENKYNFDNVQTEYEKKFLNINKNINKIIYNFK